MPIPARSVPRRFEPRSRNAIGPIIGFLHPAEMTPEQTALAELRREEAHDDLQMEAQRSRLKVLGELSRKMQVVFLTHHEHLVPLAREVLGVDLNVVQL